MVFNIPYVGNSEVDGVPASSSPPTTTPSPSPSPLDEVGNKQYVNSQGVRFMSDDMNSEGKYGS